MIKQNAAKQPQNGKQEKQGELLPNVYILETIHPIFNVQKMILSCNLLVNYYRNLQFIPYNWHIIFYLHIFQMKVLI